jgi:hypothetical protein
MKSLYPEKFLTSEKGRYKVEWPFSNHKMVAYFYLNTMHRLEAVQNVNMRLDVIDMTAPEMIEKINQDDVGVKKHVTASVRHIPGSDAFMRKERLKLDRNFEELGPPSVFGTISSADTYDNILQEMINNQSNPVLNVAKNPHICSYYFVKKLKLLIKTFFIKIADCDWYWFRIEIQHRGSLHCHYFIKFKEPSIGIANLGNIIKKIKFHLIDIEKDI